MNLWPALFLADLRRCLLIICNSCSHALEYRRGGVLLWGEILDSNLTATEIGLGHTGRDMETDCPPKNCCHAGLNRTA